MRKIVLPVIVVVAVLVLIMVFGRARLWTHRLEVRAYVQDAQGLHAGAPVRLAGVQIGSVRSVRALPEKRENPAEVVMILRTPNELKIPKDSVVSLATAGVLGETFAEINVQNASAPPVENGGVLRTMATETLTPQQLLDRLGAVLRHRPCENQDTTTSNPPKKDTDSSRKKVNGIR